MFYSHVLPSIASISLVMGVTLPGMALNLPGRSPAPSPDPAPNLISNGIQFPGIPDRGTVATGTVGGGSRSGGEACLEAPHLIPLIPADAIGTTTSDSPVLLWYIPQGQATQGELLIWNGENEYLYTQEFTLPETGGLVSFQVPPALNLNATYGWELAVICDRSDRSNDAYVWGVLKHYDLDFVPREEDGFGALQLDQPTKNRLLSQLQTLQGAEPNLKAMLWNREQTPTAAQVANAVEQAKIYSQLYLWYEALNLLVPIREQVPEEWSSLLQSINIDRPEVLAAPLVKHLNDEGNGEILNQPNGDPAISE